MAREATFKTTTYLRVAGDGSLFTSSSEPKQGFTEFTDKQGRVSYRKVFSGTEYGKITQLGIVERVFPTGKSKVLNITVENEDARDIIQIPLLNQKDELSDITRKVIALLPNVDFSRTLTISSNRKKNERGHVDRVLFMSYVEEGDNTTPIKFALKFGQNGDVPMYEVKEALDGRLTYDFTLQDKFLYGELIKQLERFQEYSRTGNSGSPASTDNKTAPTTPSKNKEQEPNIPEDDEDDDNPF